MATQAEQTPRRFWHERSHADSRCRRSHTSLFTKLLPLRHVVGGRTGRRMMTTIPYKTRTGDHHHQTRVTSGPMPPLAPRKVTCAWHAAAAGDAPKPSAAFACTAKPPAFHACAYRTCSSVHVLLLSLPRRARSVPGAPALSRMAAGAGREGTGGTARGRGHCPSARATCRLPLSAAQSQSCSPRGRGGSQPEARPGSSHSNSAHSEMWSDA